MSYLEMALTALDRDQRNVPQAPAERILLCAECPWWMKNPWTHYPELTSWCTWHFDYLAAESLQCTGWRKGEIPQPDLIRHSRSDDSKPDNKQAEVNVKDDSLGQPETCFQCPHFEPNQGPNPRQGWGRCLRRGRDRYGCAAACEAALDFKGE